MQSIDAEVQATVGSLFADAGIAPDLDRRRAPVIRSGKREPISPLVRQLVYKRDRWTCQTCGATPFHGLRDRRSGALHLDHINPWSAGGSDRTDNLRTLCESCNMARSNYVTGREQAVLPIARICLPCLTSCHEKPANTFAVYCACRHHESWAIPGWHIL